jgi:hypothetical protein
MCVIARAHMWFKEARHVALQAVTAGIRGVLFYKVFKFYVFYHAL